MDVTQLLAFALSFLLIALSPGLCMTLALSLGISIGLRRTLWMMAGELLGITLVGAAALAGIGALLTQSPLLFSGAKLVGAAYLLWSALRSWQSSAAFSVDSAATAAGTRQLISQGFVTAAFNPKAWVFFAALLPPFINPEQPLWPQASVLLGLMVVIEFICLLIYAQGGRVLRNSLVHRGLGQWLNRVSAALMAGVAAWLVLG